MIAWIKSMAGRSDFFEERMRGLDPVLDFTSIPPMTRKDVQLRLHHIVPRDANLKGLVVNPTSGTTGRPIPCPNHPSAVGCYDPLINISLRKNGMSRQIEPDDVAAVQMCAQKNTITYFTVHSYYGGAGFAKVNIEPYGWRKADDPALYIEKLAPVFLSGDPYAFLRAIELGISWKPAGILSTAVTLESTVRRAIEEHFGSRVTDMYSLNETGPIAFSCPVTPDRFHVLPHDIFVEVIKPDGKPAREGERGEIAVTGGRNPYMPLLRYLTGDTGAMDYSPCRCGEKMPSLVLFEARRMTILSKPGGGTVNTLDVARAVRMYPVLRFRFIQEADYSCRLLYEPAGILPAFMAAELEDELVSLFDGRVHVALEETVFGPEKISQFECRAGS
jgi:phenylacetate-CoA ligase